jgi:hypothetical protein
MIEPLQSPSAEQLRQPVLASLELGVCDGFAGPSHDDGGLRSARGGMSTTVHNDLPVWFLPQPGSCRTAEPVLRGALETERSLFATKLEFIFYFYNAGRWHCKGEKCRIRLIFAFKIEFKRSNSPNDAQSGGKKKIEVRG